MIGVELFDEIALRGTFIEKLFEGIMVRFEFALELPVHGVGKSFHGCSGLRHGSNALSRPARQ